MTELRPYDKHHSGIYASRRRQNDGPLPRSESILVTLVLHYEIVMFGYDPSAMNVMRILTWCRSRYSSRHLGASDVGFTIPKKHDNYE